METVVFSLNPTLPGSSRGDAVKGGQGHRCIGILAPVPSSYPLSFVWHTLILQKLCLKQ